MVDNLANFPVDPAMVAVSIAYHNPSYIADKVLPRITVGKQTFKHKVFAVEDTFRVPANEIGRLAEPAVINIGHTEATATTIGYGYDAVIPQEDIDNQGPGDDTVGDHQMLLIDANRRAREKRVADMVMAAGAYAAGFKTQLSGTSQWSDKSNSNPVSDIQTGLLAAVMRPNVMVVGAEVWSALSTHPKVLQGVTAQAVSGGVASLGAVAVMFGLQEILVGEARLNTAKYGQSATLARCWGKHALLFCRAPVTNRAALTFGYTAQWGTPISGTMPEPKMGAKGATRVREAEYLKELITAPMAAYFVQDAVA
ncbi:conserved hypothetical protein [Candidatus Defluviicoccus seviourii]|uniref:Capsid protein n=1 Tax=Candidatus Defluviicoccus seviourii TaxID=2565273 RepID=A0A564WJQ3_9PROT|nr:conserved hypothetical protein [Candidatus Defluviicoccus seviourii]